MQRDTEKLAANYLAFVQLASIRLWLRANESASLAHRNPLGRFRARKMSPVADVDRPARSAPEEPECAMNEERGPRDSRERDCSDAHHGHCDGDQSSNPERSLVGRSRSVPCRDGEIARSSIGV